MRVIFVKNVKGVGKINDVKDVADGYAENFLIRNGFAVRATFATIEQVKNSQKVLAETEVKKDNELKDLLSQIAATKSITIANHPHAKGQLYQGITAQEICHTIKEQHDIFIQKDFILNYDRPIKEVGEHAVTIGNTHRSVSYKVMVK